MVRKSKKKSRRAGWTNLKAKQELESLTALAAAQQAMEIGEGQETTMRSQRTQTRPHGPLNNRELFQGAFAAAAAYTVGLITARAVINRRGRSSTKKKKKKKKKGKKRNKTNKH